uniref:Mediator of RNA polymerase II transcription subunit 10 n=1 Tax=Setaria digitata TaxID=48799 RepID=A0A915PSU4_9BILA
MDPSLMGSMPNAPVLQETATETRYNQLEQTLENFQENARQMGVIASDFTTRSQEPLNQKIHTLISGLHELDHLKNQFMDVKIPLELLEYLDQGKNPQLYTKECLERTLNKNKEMNGKIEMYKKFRAMLLKELGEEMPNDMVLYRNLRDRKEASPQHENYNEDASD